MSGRPNWQRINDTPYTPYAEMTGAAAKQLFKEAGNPKDLSHIPDDAWVAISPNKIEVLRA